MPNVSCPTCSEAFPVAESKRDATVFCPACGLSLRVAENIQTGHSGPAPAGEAAETGNGSGPARELPDRKIGTSCPGCRRSFSLPGDAVGRRVKCPACGARFVAEAVVQPGVAPRPNSGAPELGPPNPASRPGRHWSAKPIAAAVTACSVIPFLAGYTGGVAAYMAGMILVAALTVWAYALGTPAGPQTAGRPGSAGVPSQGRKPPRPAAVLAGVLVLGAVAVLFCGGLVFINRGAGPSSGPANRAAWDAAKGFVRPALSSPDTAEFYHWDEYQDPDEQVAYVGSDSDRRYVVMGWVDCQNAFGATVRNRFSCTVRQEAGGRWTLVDGPHFR